MRDPIDDLILLLRSAVLALMAIAAMGGLLVLASYLLNGCGSDPVLPPPPLSIGDREIVYRRGHFDGPAMGGALTREDGTPVVLLEDMEGIAHAVQWFVWSHEVCHLEGYNTELGADCCAAQRLDGIGIPMWVPMEHLQENSHTDSEHPPGSVRAFTFMSCYVGLD